MTRWFVRILALVVGTVAASSNAQAQNQALAVTTGVALGVTAVGYGSLGVAGVALSRGDFGPMAGATSVGALPMLVGPPVAAISSGARARRLGGVSPALSNAALGCMAAGAGGLVLAVASPNDVRLQQVALVSSGVVWTAGTGLVIGQGLRNRQHLAEPSARVSVTIAPTLLRGRPALGIAGHF